VQNLKVANGGVAVGLPHRNSSVFKQAPYQLMESKKKNKKKAWCEHQRIDIRRSIRRKLQKQWRRIETRASEAKGPFPGGKRVGSWGKKKRKKKVKSTGRAPADLHPPLDKKRWE